MGKSYLVIGTGSVGMIIARALLARGESSVRGFDVAQPAEIPEGMHFVRGSVTNYADVLAACEGVDVVFTTVALIRYFERLPWQYAESHAVNVTGTANIVRACLERGVRVLVQASSSNVILPQGYTGERAMDETEPYVDSANAPNHYSWTKAQAERLVLAANGEPLLGGGTLSAAAARPCSAIFGPKDVFITERMLRDRKIRVLFASAAQEYMYVENVVWGMLLLERHLHLEPSLVGGHAFNLCPGEVLSRESFYRLLKFYYEQRAQGRLGWQYLPDNFFDVLSWFVETCQRITRTRIVGDLKSVTPAAFDVARASFHFSGAKARDVLGYRPVYTVDEALQKTVDFWLARP